MLPRGWTLVCGLSAAGLSGEVKELVVGLAQRAKRGSFGVGAPQVGGKVEIVAVRGRGQADG